jgi:hypothetical protein
MLKSFLKSQKSPLNYWLRLQCPHRKHSSRRSLICLTNWFLSRFRDGQNKSRNFYERTPSTRTYSSWFPIELVRLHLNPILARDYSLTNDLYNPIACLLCCSYGVAIFDRAETAQMHNPNVVYELGMMQLLKRPCVILKHTKLKRMPTDLLSMLYEDYSSQKEAVRKLSEWWTRRDA